MKLSLSSFRRRWMPGRRGMALVITLILLSVTLMMAVAYLMLSRRLRNAGSLARDTTTAQLAAESALAAAQGQMMANILATTNLAAYQYGLLVSTNFINRAGFLSQPGTPAYTSPTNVNFDYTTTGAAVSNNDLIQNIANLWLLPRVPVFVKTTNALDFRFYLDLNRNGQFEGNGPQPVFDDLGNPVMNGNYRLTNIMTGDPEWVGVLQFPNRPHGVNNQFVARYAFAAVPIGNGLDLNYIYNQTATLAVNPPNGNSPDGFFRNQGVGSWELNLAAFLADLNTNQWLAAPVPDNYYYAYNRAQNLGTANFGVAFDDARALLSYRYGYAYGNQRSASQLLNRAATVFPYDGIDGYSDGLLQTNINTNVDFVMPDKPDLPWAGADNLNHFFALPSELFDPAKSSVNFVNHLTGANPVVNPKSSYSRYTLYRLLDQMGTDSELEQGKINLNYCNVAMQTNTFGLVTNITVVPGMETNQVSWTAQNFFLAAADRMLRIYTTNWFQADPTNYLWTYYGYPTNRVNNYISPAGYGLTNIPYFGLTNQIPAFGVTRIPVLMNWYGYTNFTYSPAVNRVLQLAANLYDASTNAFYPSVFRPIFERDASNNVFIVSYTGLYSSYGTNTVIGTTDPQLSMPVDVEALPDLAAGNNMPIYNTNNNALMNVYGVPWIIGAKKYMPGLNQFTLLPTTTYVRKLQIWRSTLGKGATFWTNQLLVMNINNNMGISFWNAYDTNYPGGSPIIVVNSRADLGLMTNSSLTTIPNWVMINSWVHTNNFSYTVNSWLGSGSNWNWASAGNQTPNAASLHSWIWNTNLLASGVYNFATGGFITGANAQDFWNTNWHVVSPLPQFGLVLTNRLQAFIVDGTHVIDYIQLSRPRCLATNMTPWDPGTSGMWSSPVWGSGTANSASWGAVNQISVSRNSATPTTPPLVWNSLGFAMHGSSSVLDQTTFFDQFMDPMNPVPDTTAADFPYNKLVVQAPYSATRQVVGPPFLYQVNDPLVHYLFSDLGGDNTSTGWQWEGKYPDVYVNGVTAQKDLNREGVFQTPVPPSFSAKIMSTRYQPWGVIMPNNLLTLSYNFTNFYNMTYKDPLITRPEDWNFPTNKYPTAGWMGRVHRGTPWQTVYLKARDVLHDNVNNAYPDRGTNTWCVWTGVDPVDPSHQYDAANSAPIRDRLLFNVFTSALNGNATRGQLSVNQTNLAAWSALFSGMVALTNTIPIAPATTPTAPLALKFLGLLIQPAGPAGNSSALGYLVTNINYARAGFINTDGMVGAYEHEGDILSTAALTEQSPFLRWNDIGQQRFAIRDEVYEWLPQQMMGLLTCPTGPRYVVYCYGQALRPAPDSYASAPNNGPFGLVTNYQVVAESAARAVIRLDRRATATGTNFVPVVETYNVLPPD